MIRNTYLITALCATLIGICPTPSTAGPAGTAIREVAEFILKKFGKGVAGGTVDQVAEATAKAVAKHGDQALPLLRNSGHAGFIALKEAGENAPDVIKLYLRKGDEAIWIISEPKKLAIFIKHGDSAADALLKHPGIADHLIGRYGKEAAGALNGLSRQSAQRLSMLSEDGLLTTTKRSDELWLVIRKHGDAAMDFIWKNKGALTVAVVLATFLNDPEIYISGAKTLLVDPIATPIIHSIPWTWILMAVLAVVLLPFVVRSLNRVLVALKNATTTP